MCQLTVRLELERLKWAVASLAALGHAPGSYELENANNIQRGICARLDWCIACIDKREFIGAAGPSVVILHGGGTGNAPP